MRLRTLSCANNLKDRMQLCFRISEVNQSKRKRRRSNISYSFILLIRRFNLSQTFYTFRSISKTERTVTCQRSDRVPRQKRKPVSVQTNANCNQLFPDISASTMATRQQIMSHESHLFPTCFPTSSTDRPVCLPSLLMALPDYTTSLSWQYPLCESRRAKPGSDTLTCN